MRYEAVVFRFVAGERQLIGSRIRTTRLSTIPLLDRSYVLSTSSIDFSSVTFTVDFDINYPSLHHVPRQIIAACMALLLHRRSSSDWRYWPVVDQPASLFTAQSKRASRIGATMEQIPQAVV
jgi:hypothetical protein